MLANLTAYVITSAARLITGARALWLGCTPLPVQRLYFANHSSHGDFVLLWASLFSLLFAACFWLVLRISLESLSMDLVTHCQQLLDMIQLLLEFLRLFQELISLVLQFSGLLCDSITVDINLSTG